MIISVDNGNANTKTVHTLFKTGLTKHEVKPPMAEEIIEWNGSFYTLTNARAVYQRDKTKEDTCFILTLFAIAKEILAINAYTTQVINIELAVGLPPEHYGAQQKEFSEYFKSYGEFITYTYNDKTFSIKINEVLVFPQAFSAVALKTSSLKEFSKTYVIDIGGYTADILLLSNGKPDLEYCYSLEKGIITMNNRLKHRINSKYGIKIDDEHIYDVLFNRETILEDDVIKMIRNETGKYTNEIINELRELGIDLRVNPALFVGGGAQLLKEFLESSDQVKRPDFIPDISANAVGYELLAKSIINKRKRNSSNG